MQGVWVPGEPVTFLTAAERAWRIRIRETTAQFQLAADCGIRLRFFVSSWLRRGHLFDIDNLAKPVLDTLSRPAIPFVDVEVQLRLDPGLEIIASANPSRQVAPIVWIEHLPRTSVRRPEADPALLKVHPVGIQGFLRVHLRVHEQDLISNFDFSGFVKPTIDRLWPFLGGTDRAPEDHRIKHLIVSRTGERRTGVSIGVEPLGVGR